MVLAVNQGRRCERRLHCLTVTVKDNGTMSVPKDFNNILLPFAKRMLGLLANQIHRITFFLGSMENRKRLVEDMEQKI